MACWERELTEIVRTLIGDVSDTPDYTDERIERAILISAHQAINEITFATTYTVNVVAFTISPDPSDDDTRDEFFLYIVSLKTAVLIVGGELRKSALSSLTVQDGPSKIELTDTYRNTKNLYDSLLEQYEKAKIAYQRDNAVAAILTPYTVSNICPRPII